MGYPYELLCARFVLLRLLLRPDQPYVLTTNLEWADTSEQGKVDNVCVYCKHHFNLDQVLKLIQQAFYRRRVAID